MFKILIAEDDRELRQLFQHVLIKNGYAVTGVSNGEEAMDLVSHWSSRSWSSAAVRSALKICQRRDVGSWYSSPCDHISRKIISAFIGEIVFLSFTETSTILEIDLILSCGFPFKIRQKMEHYAVEIPREEDIR